MGSLTLAAWLGLSSLPGRQVDWHAPGLLGADRVRPDGLGGLRGAGEGHVVDGRLAVVAAIDLAQGFDGGGAVGDVEVGHQLTPRAVSWWASQLTLTWSG